MALLVVTACSSSPPAPSPGAGLSADPAVPSTSTYGRLFSQVQEDGSVSFDVAKQAFSLAIAPLPGVGLPAGDPAPEYERVDGTFAIEWLAPYYDQLTPEQKAVYDRETLAPADAVPLPEPSQANASRPNMGGAIAAVGEIGPPPPRVAADVTQQTYLDALLDARIILNNKLGRKLPFNPVFTRNLNHVGDQGVLAQTSAQVGTGTNKIFGLMGCWIRVNPELSLAPLEAIRATVAHELYHCYQYSLFESHGLPLEPHPAWIIEGSAEWVGEAAMGPSDVGRNWWINYLLTPEAITFARTYDAVGFYEHMVEKGTDVWSKLDAIHLAPNSVEAYKTAGAPANDFLDTWSSGFFRDQNLGTAYYATGMWQVGPRAARTEIGVGDGETIDVGAGYVANTIIHLISATDIVETNIDGHARLHAGPVDDIGLEGRFYCTLEAGCTCPAGQRWTGPDVEDAPPELFIAITGSLDTVNGKIIGHPLKDYCEPVGSPGPPQSGPPCTTGCGGSNGDPHMKTVDGSRYDLQAAGEYVLLRAPDGSVEMQARQEPRGGSATINTAVATLVNGHRVGFYMSETGPPDVKIDGQPVTADAVGSTDLGTGATLAAFERGYELDFPDGTRLWALSVGTWGINVLVLPSDTLRADGVGIIARVPSDARFRIPALPDGSTLPAPANHDGHYQELYGTFAPAWRVTADATLFDYDEGKTTDSYTVADFPPQTAPVDISEIPQDQLLAAQQTCAAVTDTDLAAQCAFDVFITGDDGFVATYVVTDELQSEGTATLDQPPPSGPGATPTPPSTSGPLPSGINFVSDHLAGLSSRILGPNGRLYVMSATQDVAFGDVKYSLLEIDPATGQIVQHADSHGPGMLGWAAGSLWAGEFSRAEIGTCQISRLDPDTLAEQASIPTVCADQGLTTLAPVGDAVWFVDSTGAAADGTGQHLRRIDPGTNAVDTAPAGNLALPIAVQFVNVTGAGTMWSSTSAGLLFGNRQSGLYRLLAGSDTFDALGSPQGALLEWYAAGDGVWTTTNTGESGGLGSEAGFYNGSDQPTQTMGYDGYLAGADDAAVYVEYQDDNTVADSLVRYPIDGSGPVVVAQGGFTQNPFGGQTPLGYDDSLINPLLFNGSIGVKTWLEPSASDETMQQLLVQQLQLP